jgi:hypothetical protein
MPKPGWLTLLLKIIGFAGKVAIDANEAFPQRGPATNLHKLVDLKAEAEKRRRRPQENAGPPTP